MTTLIFTVCAASCLTDSEPKTDTMRLRAKGVEGEVTFGDTAAGQVYRETIQCVYLSGTIRGESGLSMQIARHVQRPWACLRRYNLD